MSVQEISLARLDWPLRSVAFIPKSRVMKFASLKPKSIMHMHGCLTLLVALCFLSLLSCTQSNSGSQIDSSFLGGSSLSVGNSALTVSAASVNIGSAITVTFTTYDQNGQAFISPTPLTIVFSNTNGTSTGTFTAVVDHGNGTYTSTFTGTAVGTPTTIQASVSGVAFTGTLPTVQVTLSLVPPTVLNVTASTANGSYKAGQSISIQITFSAPVLVTGTPTLTLATAPNETASYTSGSTTSTLSFSYTVVGGDNSAHLDYTSTVALALAGGTIKDYSNNAATLTLPATGGAGSLFANKTIIIDTTAPAVPSGLALTVPASSPGTNATPTITVSGVANGDIVTLYSDAICTAATSAPTTASGATVAITTTTLPTATYTFYAQSTDLAGNASACSVANVTYTYSLSSLGLFAITGVTGPGDAVVDANLNNGLVPTINWGASAGATSYDVTIYDSTGSSVVCALRSTAATSITFPAGCTLTAGTTYKAKVTAQGVATLPVDATNSMFSFLVNRNPTAAGFGPSFIAQNASITINVVASATDADAGQTLSVGSVAVPSNGTTTNTATSITYTPNNNYAGTESFTYTISDGRGGSGTGTISLNVMNAFTWTGASGVNTNWSTVNNWCGTVKVDHSGCNGGAAPGNGDVAIFDGTCSSNCSTHMTTNIDVNGLNLNSGYTGTITQDTGNSVNIGGTGYSQAAGTFVGSSGGDGITLNGPFSLSGGTFTNTSGTMTDRADFSVTNTPTFSAHGGLIDFSRGCGGINITPGTIAYNNINFGGGCPSFNLQNGTMTVNGDMAISSGNGGMDSGTIMLGGNLSATSNGRITGSAIVRLTGNAGGQTITGTAGSTIPNLVIAAGAHLVTFSGTVAVNKDYTFTSASSLTTAGSTFTIGDNGTCSSSSVVPGPFAYNNVTVLGGCPVVDLNSGTMTINGNLVFSASGNGSLNSGIWNVGGNLTSSGGYLSGSGIVRLTGNAGGQTITGLSGSTIPNLTIVAGAHPVTFSGTVHAINSYTFTSASSLTSAGSTLNLGLNGQCTGISIIPGAVAYNNVTLLGGCPSFDLNGGTMTVNGNLSIGVGGNGSLSNGTIAVGGDLTSTTGNYIGGNGLIQLTGTAAAQTITGVSGSKFPNLQIAAGATPVTLSGTISIGENYTWTSSGAFTTAGSTLELKTCGATVTPGSVTYNNVTVDTGCGSTQIASSFTIGGNLTLTSVGSMNMPNPGGAYTLAVTGAVTNSAIINLNGATFTHGGALTNTGTINP
jgi:hypothetical protein